MSVVGVADVVGIASGIVGVANGFYGVFANDYTSMNKRNIYIYIYIKK